MCRCERRYALDLLVRVSPRGGRAAKQLVNVLC